MKTIDTQDIERHHKGYWFTASAKRAFSSRISATAYDDGNGRAYFVTSEKFGYSSPRAYTVRCYTWETGNVSNVGKFQAYASRSGADAAAQRMACLGAGEVVGV